MSVSEIIKGIEALPKDQRAQVIEFVHQLEEGDIPDSFKKGMADIEAGRVVDLDTALNKPPPSRR
jgi:predicted transcriptional regulator